MKNIKKVDLNLLVIFSALCRLKNTTAAAAELGLSQPAISHALSRLRNQWGDPLFVRASRGLTPTPRALELEKALEGILSDLDQVLSPAEKFDPSRATNTFRIATTDYFEQVALPSLLMRLGKEAPEVTLISRPTLGGLPKESLEAGQIDLAIAGFYGELPESFVRQKLFEDDFVCVTSQEHPRIKRKPTLPQYAEESHLLISMQGDLKSKAGQILEKNGFELKVRAGVSSFLSPGWILTSTNLVLTCPRKLAQSYVKHLPLSMFELPIEIPRIQVMQVWHERNHRDEAHVWFRKLVHEICSEL